MYEQHFEIKQIGFPMRGSEMTIGPFPGSASLVCHFLQEIQLKVDKTLKYISRISKTNIKLTVVK